MGIVSIGPFTGGCGNMVRMIGPSLLTGNFMDGITYIVCLLTGGCFGAFYYFDNFEEQQKVKQTLTDEASDTMKTAENISFAQNLKY